MNAAIALESHPHMMTNGRHIDISPRVFADRYSALGFERKHTFTGTVFVNHAARIVVAPVLTECGSIDRWHTIRRLEETLETHRAKRRGQRTLTAVALVFAALLVAMLWPHVVRAESKQGVIERAYDTSLDEAYALKTCTYSYKLGPGEAITFECFHNIIGIVPVERYRSGNGAVLISPARSFPKPAGVLVTLKNVSTATQGGTATVEFW